MRRLIRSFNFSHLCTFVRHLNGTTVEGTFVPKTAKRGALRPLEEGRGPNVLKILRRRGARLGRTRIYTWGPGRLRRGASSRTPKVLGRTVELRYGGPEGLEGTPRERAKPRRTPCSTRRGRLTLLWSGWTGGNTGTSVSTPATDRGFAEQPRRR